ncbi:MAG UNVERIFIED_CONTAM: exo-alpha-sialidase [Planctomycetaceae bacterium]|jgi:hypothetical protein
MWLSDSPSKTLLCCLLLSSFAVGPKPASAQTDTPDFSSELVFPRQPSHNHAPGIAELSNGDLIVSWYRGSGERQADDVAVYGARRKAGSREWSDSFIMADTPGFPDCNTTLMTDSSGRLFLFWPVILANTWESCLTHVKVADHPEQAGPIDWNHTRVLLLKPADFSAAAVEALDAQVSALPPLPEKQRRPSPNPANDSVRNFISDLAGSLAVSQPCCPPADTPSALLRYLFSVPDGD